MTPFWASERSWRLVVLRDLLDACTRLPEVSGPLPPPDVAWDLLARAREAAPAATEDVLAQPQIGVWAAYTLRQAADPEGVRPLWADVGYLHVVAAACAVRAGLAFELAVPVRHGTVVLPTVGAASFPEHLTHVVARGDGTVLTLDGDAVTVRAVPGDPHWHEPIRIDAEAGGVALSLTLLDRDVYRDLRRPTPPRPLGRSEIDRWRALLGAAWRLLVREQPERATAIAVCVRTLAPAPREAPYRPLSASGAEAFGGILLSEPDDATQLAVTLVHEGQHQKLGALLHLLTLAADDRGIRYYAPWRDDPRPLDGLLQGAYAFTGITDFWRVHRRHAAPAEAPLAHFEFALWRRQTLGTTRVLAGSGRLTGHGRRFVEVLHAQLSSWQDEPVPDEVGAVAEDVALDHHALWRASCMPVNPAIAASLTTAFRRGEPAPTAALSETDQTVEARPAVGRLDGRAVLHRHRLAGRTALAEVEVAGSTPPDLDLVSGRLHEARAGYLQDLDRNRGDAHAWVGLGLTLDRVRDPAARALLGRPELMLAMAADQPDPLAVARWLGRRLPDGTLGALRPAGWRVA